MKIVFDLKLKRPACPLLQAVMGGDVGVANEFPDEVWLTAPTPNMKCYAIQPEQMLSLLGMFNPVYRER